MLLLLLKIFVICTSLLAWVVLGITGIFLLRHNRYNKQTIPTIAIIGVLWGVFSFSSWYEGLFLFRKTALIPSLNSWAYTLLTPLFYLYFRCRTTGRLSDSRQWVRHLLLPAILAGIYIGMSFFGSVSDKLIYSWHEFGLNSTAWWISFRMSCYLLLVVQLSVYLPNLPGANRINDKSTQRTQLIKKEILLILYFYIISIVSLLTPFYICNILCNISATLMGGYFLKQSAYYRTIKRKIEFYLHPSLNINPADTQQTEKAEVSVVLTSIEEKRVNRLLKLPEFLHNPGLTLKMLARELGTNSTLLSRYFNQQLGVSFPEYVTTYRLDEAEALLKDTDITVIEISELVGFQTSSTFYHAFHARHHVPPSLWRKKVKSDSR